MADPSYIDAATGALTDGEAWVAIGTASPVSVTATVTFSSTTGTNNWSQYMDLFLISYYRTEYGVVESYPYLRLNGDTTSANYARQFLKGVNTTVTAAADTAINGPGPCPGLNGASDVFGASTTRWFDINSGKYTTFMTMSAPYQGDGSTTTTGVQTQTMTWMNTAAVTQIDLVADTSWATGTRFDLFGILPRMVTA